jgi:HlyD family secretion protein
MANRTRLTACVLIAAFLGWTLWAQTDPAKKPDKDKPDAVKSLTPAAKPGATHKVEKGIFKIEVTLKGVFEAEEMTEVYLKPEAWGGPMGGGMLQIARAVDQGTAVKKGDVVVQLDTDKIDQALRDLEADRYLAELSIKQAEEELPILEKSTPLDLAAAERAKKLSDEDLKKFVEIERPLSEKNAEFNVKSRRNFLDYQKEELKQLEKMYKANDLTEDTEEIILKRQRDSVEQADFLLKNAEISRDLTVKVDLPRRELGLKEGAIKQDLALERAKATLPLALSQKKLALEKMKYERKKGEERLAKLQKDREAMTVKSPADGIVYYGKCSRGQWTTAGAVASKMHRGGVIMPDEVFITIVKARPMFLRATVEEKDIDVIKAGLKAKVSPTGYSDLKLSGKVDSVSAIPVSPGNFEARVSLELSKDAEALMPGMACSIKLTPYLKEDALAVPPAAVFADESDEDKSHVFVAVKDGKPEKRPVKVGKRSGTKVEIVDGLKEGDEVLLENPEKK